MCLQGAQNKLLVGVPMIYALGGEMWKGSVVFNALLLLTINL